VYIAIPTIQSVKTPSSLTLSTNTLFYPLHPNNHYITHLKTSPIPSYFLKPPCPKPFSSHPTPLKSLSPFHPFLPYPSPPPSYQSNPPHRPTAPPPHRPTAPPLTPISISTLPIPQTNPLIPRPPLRPPSFNIPDPHLSPHLASRISLFSELRDPLEGGRGGGGFAFDVCAVLWWWWRVVSFGLGWV